MIEVTCRDLETGKTETRQLWNDYVVIVAGNRYIDGIQSYANGTTVVTIKRSTPEEAQSGE